MKPEFRFRLNSTIVPEICVRRAVVNGERTGDLEIAANVPDIGWFAIDDNSHLLDKDLPRFNLEYRDESAWALIPPYEKKLIEDKGWRTVTPQELLRVLINAGVIDVR